MVGKSRAVRGATALAVLLALAGTAASVSAPTSGRAATASASLRQQIEERAEHDADQLGHADLATALQLFSDNEQGMSPRQIAAIYDSAYSDAASERMTLGERFAQLAPWLIVVLMALALIFRDAVQRWISTAVDAIGQRVWRRIAGSRVMRRTALRRYRASVTRKMRKVQVIFRPNKPLDMARIFVPLKVAGAAREETQDALQAVYEHRRIVVVGPPGSGKSILLRHLAYTYSLADGAAPTADLIPVWIELHRLSDRGVDPLAELEAAFARNGFPNASKFLTRNLEAGRVLLLLDGLDEVQSSERQRVSRALGDLLERFPSASAVITCRNVVYKGEFDAHVERTFELMEFNDQQVQTFLASWAPEMPSSKSVDQLVLALRENPRLMVLARNPLMLTIIAHLYTESPTYQLPNSRAEFYSESSDILLRHWHEQHNLFDAAEKRAALRQLALVGQEAESDDTADRRTLSTEIAVKIVQDVLRDRGKSPDEARPLLDEIVERSGLLLSIDAGERYQFAHLTFQEYFAAEKLLSQPRELLDRYDRDADAWREVVKIWCGLVDNATDMVDSLWRAGAELTALEALADARSVGVEISDRIVSVYVARLRDGEADEAIERALGALAANVESRGRLVLRRLQQVLDEAEPDRVASAARAIAASYLPAAAKILSEHFDLEAVRAPLEQLGDLAVDGLSRRAGAGELEALESLTRIGTASAARSVAQIMWDEVDSLWDDDDDPMAGAAAWRLATLLPNPEVQRALADVEPQMQGVRYRWIWEPFARGGNWVAETVGRAADLILRTPEEAVPAQELRIDPRVAFPLCTVASSLLRDEAFLASPAAPEVLAATRAAYGMDLSTRSVERVSHREVMGMFTDMPLGRGVWLYDNPNRYSSRRRPSMEQADAFTRAIAEAASPSRGWRTLFLSMPVALRLEAIRCAIGFDAPTSADWTALNRPVTYSFARSWHRGALQALILAVSAVAAVSAVRLLLDGSLPLKALAALAAFWLGGGSVWMFTGVMADEPDVMIDYFAAPFDLIDDPFDFEAFSIVGFLPTLGWFASMTLAAWGLELFGVLIFWTVFLALVAALSWRGHVKVRAANNPFHGLDFSLAHRAVVSDHA